MTDREQTKAFASDLGALIDRYRQEFDITHGQVIGVLQIVVHAIIAEALETEDEE